MVKKNLNHRFQKNELIYVIDYDEVFIVDEHDEFGNVICGISLAYGEDTLIPYNVKYVKPTDFEIAQCIAKRLAGV